MNENSYLNPTQMKEHCDSAIRKLENDNEAIRVAENSLNTFLNDSEIKSEAFDTLKLQMSDYITVLQAMRTANNSDIADFTTLKSSVGDELLIGGIILEQKAAALRQKAADEETAQEYEREAKKASWPWESWYYNWKADKYWNMAEIDQRLYLMWQAKEDRYDEIEGITSGLFLATTAMRAAAETGLCAINNAFQNGAYVSNRNAAWRTELAKSYIERILTVNADGTITAKWDEVEKVLNKPAEEITQEEYEALALLYLNIDETELSHFLGLCMDRTSDVDIPWYKEMIQMGTNFSGGENFSEWTVNTEKLDKLIEQVSIASDGTLAMLQVIDKKKQEEEYRVLLDQRNIIIQRMTLLEVVGEVGTFRGEYQAEHPTIRIKKNEDESLTMSFCQFRNIGSEVSPTMSNLGTSTVTISKTKNGVVIDREALGNAELSFQGYFGGTSLANETYTFVADEITGEMISQGAEGLGNYVAEKTGKEALKNVIGYVPIAGDIAGFAMDMAESRAETEAATNFITGQFDTLESTKIYNDFDCSVSFVEYDIVDNNQVTLYVQTGVDTANAVKRVNEALGTQITEAEVLKNPNGVYNLTEELFEENPENEEKYNYAIKNY